MANIQLGGSIGTTGTSILGSVNITISDANYTLSVAEYTNHYINITGALTAERNVIVPLTSGVTYLVNNNTTGGQAIRFKGPTGNGVIVNPSDKVLVVNDGIDYYYVNAPDREIEFEGYGIIQSGFAEVGQYITNARFKAFYTPSPVTVILSDDDITADKNVSTTPTSFSSDGYFQKLTFGEEVNFTITTDGYFTNTFTVVWGQRNYFGVGPAGNSTEDFILSLNSFVNNSVEGLFAVTAGPTQKIYYAFRTGYGTPTFIVNGFEGGFTLVSTSISLTNPYGFTENYTLYESDNLDLGITSVEVY